MCVCGGGVVQVNFSFERLLVGIRLLSQLSEGRERRGEVTLQTLIELRLGFDRCAPRGRSNGAAPLIQCSS